MSSEIIRRANWANLLRVVCNPIFGARQASAIVRFQHNAKPLKEFLVEVTGESTTLVQELINEAQASPLVASVFERLRQLESTRRVRSIVGNVSMSDWFTLYSLVRLTQPETVVETGVASGASSTAILSALEKNGRGWLYSIDLPPDQVIGRRLRDGLQYDRAFEGRTTGWLVPQQLKHRWQLVLGDVRDVLKPLLDQLGEIDMFFHDDLHTPEHMFWEFNLVWPYLKAGGILTSDDVTYGWSDFIRSVDTTLSPYLNHDFLGAVRKEWPSHGWW